MAHFKPRYIYNDRTTKGIAGIPEDVFKTILTMAVFDYGNHIHSNDGDMQAMLNAVEAMRLLATTNSAGNVTLVFSDDNQPNRNGPTLWRYDAEFALNSAYNYFKMTMGPTKESLSGWFYLKMASHRRESIMHLIPTKGIQRLKHTFRMLEKSKTDHYHKISPVFIGPANGSFKRVLDMSSFEIGRRMETARRQKSFRLMRTKAKEDRAKASVLK